MNTEQKSKLEREARYLHIAIPYDKDDELITFDDGLMTELECDEEFVPLLYALRQSFPHVETVVL